MESTLDKKHDSVAYHYIRNAVAANGISVGWIDGNNNLADALTKCLAGNTRQYLFGNWMY